MNYSICIDALFPKQNIKTSLSEVKKCGYSAIEFWSWWDKDIPAIIETCSLLQLSVAAFSTRMDINPGNPANLDAYLKGLKDSIKTAKQLNCNTIITQAGRTIEGIPFDLHRKSLIQALQNAVPILENAGITLVIEPLNVNVDHPDYHLVFSRDAFSIVQNIKSPYIKILYDIYHQQISEGNITQIILENIEHIGHFHIAAVPGRVEPCNGELNYPYIIEKIKESGYSGYIGLEYMPKRNAVETLKETHLLLPR